MIRTYGMALSAEVTFLDDNWIEIIKYSKSQLTLWACVNKHFEKMSREFLKSNPNGDYFGTAEWIKYGADPGIEPLLPLKMFQDFDPSKEILTLIPEMINNEPLTLRSIDILVSKHKKVTSIYTFPNSESLIPLENHKSDWSIFLKSILPETRNKLFLV